MLELQHNIFDFINSLNFKLGENLKCNYSNEFENFLKTSSIHYENIRDQEILIERKNLPFEIFEEVSDYLILNTIKEKNDCLILSYEGYPVSLIKEESYINFEKKDEFYLFSNSISFVQFIDFFKTKQTEDEEGFHFVDYVNDISRKIVLTSLAEKSRLIIKYYKNVPLLDTSINYSKFLQLFLTCFTNENANLPKFLKSSLIKWGARFEEKNRAKNIFEDLANITNEAKINFEVYINNLSIDKISKDYDEYKSKYFHEVSEILKKLTNQIIGFPLVIASSLFAIEKVKNNETFLYILIVALLVTTIYLILLLNMSFKDLNYIKHLSDKDYKAIKNNNFFIKYPKERETFDKIQGRIQTRIKNLITICDTYFWTLSFTNTAIIWWILKYLNANDFILFVTPAIITVLLVISRNKIWNEE
ncbi:hypothetical protein [Gillisia sp. CAL575]|uniref:hypothetical protein n=1 Tax=Gillisia sp. CAL575 TaxID=985255 RepID=UPI0003A5AABB|nr:hypothetical protein [Gillisia sp. CAL575]